MLGGFTRPVSGLIGNVRHRWMDEKGEAIEYTDAPPAAAGTAAATPADTPADGPEVTPADTPADSIMWYQRPPLD